MLSDFRDTSKTFAVSVGYSHTDSGASKYDTFSLGARYRVLDWLQLTGSVPYKFVDGHDVVYDEPSPGVIRRNVFEYEDEGIGDVNITGWFDLLYPFKSAETIAAEKEAAKTETIEGTGRPLVFLGLGVKLDTGKHDQWDQTKYNFDRSKALTGELSKSDGMLPTRYQLGTGTTDALVGIVFLQRFGRFTPSASLSYQMSGGENSIGYERGDRLSYSTGLQYTIWQPDCNRRVYASCNVSGTSILEKDYDYSENTALGGSQAKGEVSGSDGTYLFYGFGLGYDLTENLTVAGSVTLPLSSPDEDSEYSFDTSYGLSLQFRF